MAVGPVTPAEVSRRGRPSRQAGEGHPGGV